MWLLSLGDFMTQKYFLSFALIASLFIHNSYAVSIKPRIAMGAGASSIIAGLALVGKTIHNVYEDCKDDVHIKSRAQRIKRFFHSFSRGDVARIIGGCALTALGIYLMRSYPKNESIPGSESRNDNPTSNNKEKNEASCEALIQQFEQVTDDEKRYAELEKAFVACFAGRALPEEAPIRQEMKALFPKVLKIKRDRLAKINNSFICEAFGRPDIMCKLDTLWHSCRKEINALEIRMETHSVSLSKSAKNHDDEHRA